MSAKKTDVAGADVLASVRVRGVNVLFLGLTVLFQDFALLCFGNLDHVNFNFLNYVTDYLKLLCHRGTCQSCHWCNYRLTNAS